MVEFSSWSLLQLHARRKRKMVCGKLHMVGEHHSLYPICGLGGFLASPALRQRLRTGEFPAGVTVWNSASLSRTLGRETGLVLPDALRLCSQLPRGGVRLRSVVGRGECVNNASFHLWIWK